MKQNKNFHTFIVSSKDAGQRLDLYLFGRLPLSRTYIKKYVKGGYIRLDAKILRPAYKLKFGDKIVVDIPESAPFELKAENIPLDVVYENSDFLVVNKPSDMVVHPVYSGAPKSTLVNAVLAHCKGSLSGISGTLKPGIVHRLDKNTSGCLLVAKNDKIHRYLAEQFKERKVKKIYVALVKDRLSPESGTIESPVGRSYRDRKKMSVHTFSGRDAVTHYEVLKYLDGCTLLEVRIVTGRTHQIRVHLAAIGHPVIGDDTYGDKRVNKVFREKYGLERQFLHANNLAFYDLKGKLCEFEAPLAADLVKVLSFF